jgi:hypothetical protein
MTIRTFYRLAVWLPLALPRRVPLAYGYMGFVLLVREGLGSRLHD